MKLCQSIAAGILWGVHVGLLVVQILDRPEPTVTYRGNTVIVRQPIMIAHNQGVEK